MKYEDAKQSALDYMASDISRDLDDVQVEQLIRHLANSTFGTATATGHVPHNGPIRPQAVANIVAKLFPVQKHQRVVPPREQQPKQTHDEILAEIAAYFNQGWWSQIAPGTIPAVTTDAKIGSKINHAAFFDAVTARINRGEQINRDSLNVIVLNLFQRGLLEKPQPVVAPPPPPPTQNDLNNDRVRRDRAMNDPSKSPIKGSKESAKPLVTEHKSVLTEEQRVALNEKKRTDDAVIAEAQHRISNHTGYNHGQTFSHRRQLEEVFRQAMDEGVEAKEVLSRVVEKIDSLVDNGSVR